MSTLLSKPLPPPSSLSTASSTSSTSSQSSSVSSSFLPIPISNNSRSRSSASSTSSLSSTFSDLTSSTSASSSSSSSASPPTSKTSAFFASPFSTRPPSPNPSHMHQSPYLHSRNSSHNNISRDRQSTTPTNTSALDMRKPSNVETPTTETPSKSKPRSLTADFFSTPMKTPSPPRHYPPLHPPHTSPLNEPSSLPSPLNPSLPLHERAHSPHTHGHSSPHTYSHHHDRPHSNHHHSDSHNLHSSSQQHTDIHRLHPSLIFPSRYTSIARSSLDEYTMGDEYMTNSRHHHDYDRDHAASSSIPVPVRGRTTSGHSQVSSDPSSSYDQQGITIPVPTLHYSMYSTSPSSPLVEDHPLSSPAGLSSSLNSNSGLSERSLRSDVSGSSGGYGQLQQRVEDTLDTPRPPDREPILLRFERSLLLERQKAPPVLQLNKEEEEEEEEEEDEEDVLHEGSLIPLPTPRVGDRGLPRNEGRGALLTHVHGEAGVSGTGAAASGYGQYAQHALYAQNGSLHHQMPLSPLGLTFVGTGGVEGGLGNAKVEMRRSAMGLKDDASNSLTVSPVSSTFPSSSPPGSTHISTTSIATSRSSTPHPGSASQFTSPSTPTLTTSSTGPSAQSSVPPTAISSFTPTTPSTTPSTGPTLRLIRPLGHGAFSSVWLAEDMSRVPLSLVSRRSVRDLRRRASGKDRVGSVASLNEKARGGSRRKDVGDDLDMKGMKTSPIAVPVVLPVQPLAKSVSVPPTTIQPPQHSVPSRSSTMSSSSTSSSSTVTGLSSSPHYSTSNPNGSPTSSNNTPTPTKRQPSRLREGLRNILSFSRHGHGHGAVNGNGVGNGTGNGQLNSPPVVSAPSQGVVEDSRMEVDEDSASSPIVTRASSNALNVSSNSFNASSNSSNASSNSSDLTFNPLLDLSNPPTPPNPTHSRTNSDISIALDSDVDMTEYLTVLSRNPSLRSCVSRKSSLKWGAGVVGNIAGGSAISSGNIPPDTISATKVPMMTAIPQPQHQQGLEGEVEFGKKDKFERTLERDESLRKFRRRVRGVRPLRLGDSDGGDSHGPSHCHIHGADNEAGGQVDVDASLGGNLSRRSTVSSRRTSPTGVVFGEIGVGGGIGGAGVGGRLVAVKMTPRRVKGARGKRGKEEEERTRVGFVREVEVLKHISHPNITPLLAHLSTTTHHILVLPFLPGGDLLGLVNDDVAWSKLSEPVLRRIWCELCKAVEWMHGVGLVHRDIKLENILLTTPLFSTLTPISSPPSLSSLPPPTSPLIKLSDFGLSRFVQLYPNGTSELLTTRCGSEAYAAPELVLGGLGVSYDARYTDAWACGVVLYGLVGRQLPFGEGVGVEEGVMNVNVNARGHSKIGGERGAVGSGVGKMERKQWLMKIALGEWRWPGEDDDDGREEEILVERGEQDGDILVGPTLVKSKGARRIVERLLVRDRRRRARIMDLWDDEWMKEGVADSGNVVLRGDGHVHERSGSGSMDVEMGDTTTIRGLSIQAGVGSCVGPVEVESEDGDGEVAVKAVEMDDDFGKEDEEVKAEIEEEEEIVEEEEEEEEQEGLLLDQEGIDSITRREVV